jgi:hypothetical protein
MRANALKGANAEREAFGTGAKSSGYAPEELAGANKEKE